MGGFYANDLSKWSGGKWLGEELRASIGGFAYDTRLLKKGDLFVAFKTEQRDGHDFLSDAKEKGAVGAIVQNGEKVESCEFPVLLVDHTLLAFQAIARGFRESWNFPVIGITGSCGKTTTKDLLCGLLGGFPRAQGTKGNLNNLIGVPATLLGVLPNECSYAVVEAGISETGEMAALADMINPDHVVFTAIGPSHLEGLGSVEGVAKEKGILASQPRTSQLYFGESCQPYQKFLNTNEADAVSVSETDSSRWQYRIEPACSGMQLIFETRNETYFIEGTGRGLASNAALAIAVARDLNVSPKHIQERLANWKPSGMRGEWKTVGESRVYLDCYNANPLSMLDSLDNFRTQTDSSRNRLYLLGSMEELGSESAYWHERLGSELQLGPKDRAYLIGEAAESVLDGIRKSSRTEGHAECLTELESLRGILADFEGDVFLKGSRKHQLEKAMEFLPRITCDEGASC